MTAWQMLAIVMLICGFCFKIAAVPLQMYAGDVYQGAATPVTAFLSFVPKTSGFVAIIKLLSVVGGDEHALPFPLVKLLWILAVLTMFYGNLLGLMQSNVKRVLAYSSIAHSGYMLVGITVLAGAGAPTIRTEGLEGVLFYLAAYGIVNTAAFGVLILLPSRSARLAGRVSPSLADSAETFEDIAGQGRKHVGLGLAMAVACFSLIGIPLTIGFLGKLMLIKPALHGQFYWLVVLTMINAAISAAYYLRIIGTLFLRPDPVEAAGLPAGAAPSSAPAVPAFAARFHMPLPTLAAIVLSVLGTLLLGSVLPATDMLASQVRAGATFDSRRTPLPDHVARRDLKALTPVTIAR
jgi:NADH-quinone oxidoreductase subunit N